MIISGSHWPQQDDTFVRQLGYGDSNKGGRPITREGGRVRSELCASLRKLKISHTQVFNQQVSARRHRNTSYESKHLSRGCGYEILCPGSIRGAGKEPQTSHPYEPSGGTHTLYMSSKRPTEARHPSFPYLCWSSARAPTSCCADLEALRALHSGNGTEPRVNI